MKTSSFCMRGTIKIFSKVGCATLKNGILIVKIFESYLRFDDLKIKEIICFKHFGS